MSIKRRRKVPYVEPLQQTECGLSCVAMILRYYKSNESLKDLREYLEIGRDGSTMLQLKHMLEGLNFNTKVYKSSAKGLSQIDLPAILFWDDNHFVVLEKINDDYAIILDPGYGRRKTPISEFEELYTGFALTCRPNENFVRQKKKKSIWFNFLSIIFEKKFLYVKIAILSVITYFLTLGMPIFIQNLLDGVVDKKDTNFINNSVIFLACFSIVYVLFNHIKNVSLIKLKVHIDNAVNTKVFSHLLKVPYKFFDIRNKADILFSANSCFVIRETFANQMINGIIDCGAVIFISYYMYRQSALLAFVAFLIFVINLILVAATQPLMFEQSKYLLSEQSKVQSAQVESVFSILGIKMSAIENDVYNNWHKKYSSYLSKYSYKEKISNYIATLTSFTQTVSPMIILCVSIYMYANSLVTIGQVIAFHSLSNTFFSLSRSVFNTWSSFINSSAFLERLGDIINSDKEDDSEDLKKVDISGEIKLNNVSFSYSAQSKQVIKNIDLHIKKGQKVAIVGKSGSGKSTLAKLLVGLYSPTEGQIMFDGIDLSNLDKKYLRKQLGIVPQDVSLFNKSIYNNISMNREDVDLDNVKKVCEVAQISKEIEAMPMGYHTIISEMGMNLSGGQRQRIVLARALLNEPKVLILDEATSSLDYINEKRVSDYFKNIGCTRIVIAHRLSTILDSDLIIVLENGEIVESGSHAELINRRSEYYKLYHASFESEKENIAV